MSDPKLSVIITTHLRPKLLARSLSSVKALGDRVQIVLCADEGSSETRKVAVEHLREGDIFLSLPGYRGPADTRNAGLQFASGEWVSFLDDDDTFDPDVASQLLERLEGDFVYYTNFRKIFERTENDGAITQVRSVIKNTNRKNISEIDIRNFIIVSAFFVPRHIASGLRFSADLSMSEDWEFLLQLKKLAEFRHLDMCCSNWHIDETTEGSRNKGKRKMRAENYLKIYQMHPSAGKDISEARAERLRELGLTV